MRSIRSRRVVKSARSIILPPGVGDGVSTGGHSVANGGGRVSTCHSCPTGHRRQISTSRVADKPAGRRNPFLSGCKYTYNGLADRVSTTDPLNKVTTTARDHLGRATLVTEPLGRA
ncbi:hypothetical protein Acsp05_06420 [Actinokineospora sp. NBRC 105648]|nr:hypothetical protein Acsp05_06420 [Actinokineospora sp. NBRC 105648]